jgi:hypothetical protein
MSSTRRTSHHILIEEKGMKDWDYAERNNRTHEALIERSTSLDAFNRISFRPTRAATRFDSSCAADRGSVREAWIRETVADDNDAVEDIPLEVIAKAFVLIVDDPGPYVSNDPGAGRYTRQAFRRTEKA